MRPTVGNTPMPVSSHCITLFAFTRNFKNSVLLSCLHVSLTIPTQQIFNWKTATNELLEKPYDGLASYLGEGRGGVMHAPCRFMVQKSGLTYWPSK